MGRCSHCGANTEDELEDVIECMMDCPNCLADLKMKGNWTGVAHNIMLEMVEKHGIETVRLTHEKIAFKRL